MPKGSRPFGSRAMRPGVLWIRDLSFAALREHARTAIFSQPSDPLARLSRLKDLLIRSGSPKLNRIVFLKYMTEAFRLQLFRDVSHSR
jgi:hypothetical protein